MRDPFFPRSRVRRGHGARLELKLRGRDAPLQRLHALGERALYTRQDRGDTRVSCHADDAETGGDGEAHDDHRIREAHGALAARQFRRVAFIVTLEERAALDAVLHGYCGEHQDAGRGGDETAEQGVVGKRLHTFLRPLEGSVHAQTIRREN